MISKAGRSFWGVSSGEKGVLGKYREKESFEPAREKTDPVRQYQGRGLARGLKEQRYFEERANKVEGRLDLKEMIKDNARKSDLFSGKKNKRLVGRGGKKEKQSVSGKKEDSWSIP